MLCGFLSQEGEYIKCDPWDHMGSARKIAKDKYSTFFGYGVEAEDFLYDKGYVVFGARHASHKWKNKNKEIMTLTNEQIDFIIEKLSESNNDDQKESMLQLLEFNDDYKEYYILQEYKRKG